MAGPFAGAAFLSWQGQGLEEAGLTVRVMAQYCHQLPGGAGGRRLPPAPDRRG